VARYIFASKHNRLEIQHEYSLHRSSNTPILAALATTDLKALTVYRDCTQLKKIVTYACILLSICKYLFHRLACLLLDPSS